MTSCAITWPTKRDTISGTKKRAWGFIKLIATYVSNYICPLFAHLLPPLIRRVLQKKEERRGELARKPFAGMVRVRMDMGARVGSDE